MANLSRAVCDRELSTAGEAPEWVHLFTNGKMTGRDGREFDLADPGAIVHVFEASGVDLPIDYEHQGDKPDAGRAGPVPAAGWIKALKADRQGLWGRVEWTAAAHDLIARREYRHLSPSFLVNLTSRQIVRLLGAGLVHRPNLHLTALASEEIEMNDAAEPLPPTAPAPAATGGTASQLDVDALVAAVLTKLLAVLRPAPGAATEAAAQESPDPARFVPVAAVQELLADRNTKIATMREADATARVDAALRAGHITPAMREWATALCLQDIESFDTFVAKSPARLMRILGGRC